jgi:hypothetical protein
MQRAVIFGDLSSDSTSEQYPTVTLCGGCIMEDEARMEDQQIVALDGLADPDDGPCEWCGAETDED